MSAEYPPLDLAALVVDGKERGATEVIHENGTVYLPFDSLADIPGITLDRAKGVVNTPIGSITYDTLTRSQRYNGFLSLDTLDEALKIFGDYDTKTLTLTLQTPWHANKKRRRRITPVPDVEPPAFAISGFRLDATGIYRNPTYEGFGEFDLRGRAAGGLWHLGARKQNLIDDPYVDQLYWMRQFKRIKILAGIQNTQTNLLMPYTQMTGLQALVANYDLADSSSMSQPTLGPGIGPDNRTVTGRGPAGGTAVLRRNDQPVATVTIGLDGRYSFDLSQEDLSGSPRFEVWLYSRSPFGEPDERITLERLSNAHLLDPGQFILLAGGGKGENMLHASDTNRTIENVGTIYGRLGLTPWLTVEGGATRDEYGLAYTSAALSMHLAPGLDATATLAKENDKLPYRIAANGRWTATRFNGYWMYEPEGYRRLTYDRRDGYVELNHQLLTRLNLGVQGRYRDDANASETRFLLPTARIVPVNALTLTAYPNYTGDYRFTVGFRPSPTFRADYTYEDRRHRLGINQRLGDEWSLYFDGYVDARTIDRYEAGAQWRDEYRNDLFFRIGIIYSEGLAGFHTELRHRLLPGIYARYELRKDPTIAADDFYAMLNLTFDFRIARNRLYPAQGRWGNRTMRGNIVGDVRIEGTDKLLPVDNLRLLIDGRLYEAGESNGHLWVGDLEPGVYEVSLDPETLPMEYVPVKKRYYVRVENGAVTPVAFFVRVEYGAAGQVTADGRPLSGHAVDVFNAKGERIDTVYTDRFGYFRIDGLTPGTYVLRSTLHTADGKTVTAERDITVTDDFIFDQNLTFSSTASS